MGRGRWRVTAIVAAACAVPACAATIASAAPGATAPGAPQSAESLPARSQSLPLGARESISAALARDSPAGTARASLRADPFVLSGVLAAKAGAGGEELGESVAIWGHTIVVGTSHFIGPTGAEQGAAYVFTSPASGWAHAVQRAVLTASDAQGEELFGHSVAISGDTIVVGAPFREVDGRTGEGAAYVFVRPRSGWRRATQSARLTAAGGRAHEYFGEAVAISGKTIVCGAPGRRVGTDAMRGAVDVFAKPSPGWSGSPIQTAELTASDGAADDALGISVAIAGRTIVAGADQRAVAGHSDQGAAYVFEERRSGWHNGSDAAELTDADGQEGELFAHAVAIAGETIVAGAPDWAAGAAVEAGAAYVFVRPDRGWHGALAQSVRLTAADGERGDTLGGSLALSGDAIVAGAPDHGLGRSTEAGAVYLFERPASGWVSATQSEELTVSGGDEGDRLGRSVAIWRGTIVAGAPDHHVGAGVAYAFRASPP